MLEQALSYILAIAIGIAIPAVAVFGPSLLTRGI